jgi:hypothetical protein
MAVFVGVLFYITASRPMDDEGYEYWSGVVRYQFSAGNTGAVDVPPGKGVYEVQLETGSIVLAYTMSESGHKLGECVTVREQRRPLDARPKYRIMGESERCDNQS